MLRARAAATPAPDTAGPVAGELQPGGTAGLPRRRRAAGCAPCPRPGFAVTARRVLRRLTGRAAPAVDRTAVHRRHHAAKRPDERPRSVGQRPGDHRRAAAALVGGPLLRAERRHRLGRPARRGQVRHRRRSASRSTAPSCGTGLTEEQRSTLSVHEFCSVARIGLWFEMILMQMLLRYAYDRDPRTAHIQYALIEIADECRHSMMFAKADRALRRAGLRAAQGRARARPAASRPSAPGPRCSPGRCSSRRSSTSCSARGCATSGPAAVPDVNKIHVTEEARHVRYAREELQRIIPKINRAQKAFANYQTARIASSS